MTTRAGRSEPAARTVKLANLAHNIVLSWGWRRRSIAFVAGALSVLAMAPFNAWPILFFTLPTLVWLIDGIGGRGWAALTAAAAIGWWFGFGYFLAGLYWLGYAFLVDAQTFGWLLPFAVVGLPAVLAIYTALGVALARALWQRGALRVLALGVSLTAAEWLRGHAFTGFPWNAFGYALTTPLVLSASGFRTRNLGPDLHRNCGLRQPRHTDRRPHPDAPAMAAVRIGRSHARRLCRSLARRD